jgi:hypothetical protein
MKSIKTFSVTIAALVAAFCIGLGLSEGVMAQEAAPGAEKEKEDFFGEDVAGWRIRDFKPYVTAIHELQKLNKEYSDNLLKLAIDEYSTGLDILEDMENDIVKVKQANKERKHLNERFYWQEIDRRNQEQRQIYYKKQEAKMKAVTYLTKSINYLDQIQNSEVRQEPRFLNFQSRIFQVYVSTQYDLHNFMPCIPILERYVTLSDANAKDVWAYKYMASCYGYMERILGRYRHAGEDEINRYKNKKNRSMLTAVELTYGVDSPHYKHIQEIVEQDEKRSERINDFK